MSRNTGIEYGDLRKIANLTGFSYDYVRRVVVYGNRRNEKIMQVAETIAKSNSDIRLIIEENKVA